MTILQFERHPSRQALANTRFNEEGGTMPLTRGKEHILMSMKGVKFLMMDGETEVPCTASHDLLENKFGSNGAIDEAERAFRGNRDAIEKAASDKYDAGQIEPCIDPKVVVTAYDMSSPLIRKM
jgi:hypothetical protein